MATRGEQAFNTEDPKANNSHARLLVLWAQGHGMTIQELAEEFDVTVDTVRTWIGRPLGYQPPPRGRAPSEAAPTLPR